LPTLDDRPVIPRPLLTLALSAWLAVAAGPLASAQPQSITPGAASEAQIQEFVAAQVQRLTAGDPAECAAARTALMGPLLGADVPPAFRLAYSAALSRDLARLVDGSDDLISINAVEVAAEVATGLTVSIALNALDDSRPAIRYAGARAVGRALAAVAEGRAAIPGNQIDQLLDGAAKRLAAESHPQVVDALVRAFSAPAADPSLLARSLREMCNAMATQIERWRREGPSDETAMVSFRATNTAFQWLFNQAGGVQGDRPFAQAAALMAGQALVFTSSWLETTPAGQRSGDQQQAAIDLAGAAERVLVLSHMLLAQEQVRETITPAVAGYMQGRRAVGDVQRETSLWTGPSGRLLKAPYNAKADSFR